MAEPPARLTSPHLTSGRSRSDSPPPSPPPPRPAGSGGWCGGPGTGRRFGPCGEETASGHRGLPGVGGGSGPAGAPVPAATAGLEAASPERAGSGPNPPFPPNPRGPSPLPLGARPRRSPPGRSEPLPGDRAHGGCRCGRRNARRERGGPAVHCGRRAGVMAAAVQRAVGRGRWVCTAAAPRPWRLFGAMCLLRLPRITQPLEKEEEEMAALMGQVEGGSVAWLTGK